MIEVGKIYFIRKGNFMMEDKNFGILRGKEETFFLLIL